MYIYLSLSLSIYIYTCTYSLFGWGWEGRDFIKRGVLTAGRGYLHVRVTYQNPFKLPSKSFQTSSVVRVGVLISNLKSKAIRSFTERIKIADDNPKSINHTN